jgi:hypothetical protein
MVVTAALLAAGCGERPPDTPAATADSAAQAPAPQAPGTEQAAVPAPASDAAAPAATPAGAATRRAAGSQPAAPPPHAAAPTAAPPPPPPPPPPRTLTLAAETPIAVYTTSTLSTSANQSGEPFKATLANAIADEDWVVAREGAVVEGVIVESDPGGKVKGVASITVALRAIHLADGRTIQIDTTPLTQQAKTSKGKDAKKIGLGTGVGAAIGAIAGGGKGAAIGAAVGAGAGTAGALATRGDAATLPSESLLTFTLAAPVTIVERRR